MKVRIDPTGRLLFNALGLIFSVIPVAVAIFSYFPLWLGREDASILSGIALLLFAAALIPLYRYVRDALRSASAPLMWFIIFLTFLILSRIADEITVISFVGFLGNLAGSVFFRIAKEKKNE